MLIELLEVEENMVALGEGLRSLLSEPRNRWGILATVLLAIELAYDYYSGKAQRAKARATEATRQLNLVAEVSGVVFDELGGFRRLE